MKLNNIKIIPAAVMFAALSFSQPASAGFVSAAVASASSLIAAAVASMQTATLAFMHLESAQQHADSEKSNVVKKQVAEAVVDAESSQRFRELAADISDKTADNGQFCVSYVMSHAIASSIETKDSMASSLTSLQKDRTMNTASTAAVVANTFRDHDKFCSAYDAGRGRCGTKGNVAAVPLAQQDLELKAGNVLTPNANQTYTPLQLEAAKTYANGLINPFPSVELPQGFEKSAQGKAYIVAKRVEQQRLSLAYESINQSISIRTPNTDIGSSVLTMLGFQNPSQLAVIQKVANNFNDVGWHARMTLSNQSELLKENVRQNAFKNWMDYNSFLQMERIEGLLAATLSIQAKESSQTLLNAQRGAASQASGNSSQ